MSNLHMKGMCHVDMPDEMIMQGIYTKQLLVPIGYPIRATTDTNTNYKRKFLLIRNNSANAADLIYWGGPDVSSSNGMALAPGESVSFSFKNGRWLDVYITGNNAAGITASVGELI